MRRPAPGSSVEELCAKFGPFPGDIDFRTAGKGSARVLGPFLPVREAARRLLFLQYRAILLNLEGARRSSDAEALHDLRLAIRRLRVVLRAFRKPLAGTSADRIEGELRRLNRILGAARDLDVWIEFLSQESVSGQFAGHRLWARFVGHQRELRRLQQATVRRHLHGAGFTALLKRISRFLNVELSGANEPGLSDPLESLARKALGKNLRRTLKLAHLRRARSPEKLHRLRITLRRLRYMSGFFEGILGKPIRKLSRRAHGVEKILGDMRDADLALARILSDGPTPPRLLIKHLEQFRQSQAATLEDAWTRFAEPKLALEVRRQLATL